MARLAACKAEAEEAADVLRWIDRTLIKLVCACCHADLPMPLIAGTACRRPVAACRDQGCFHPCAYHTDSDAIQRCHTVSMTQTSDRF